MKLFYGLGNPDKNYQNTRHNIGQIIINKIIADNKLKVENFPKANASIARSTDTIYSLSHDYMNNSGITATKLINFFKINLSDFYVVHDDLDLEVGDYRIQFDRGPAGHHGIESIISHLHSQQFHRIRIGIGKPKNNVPVEDFVLMTFTPEEKSQISLTIDKILSEIKKL